MSRSLLLSRATTEFPAFGLNSPVLLSSCRLLLPLALSRRPQRPATLITNNTMRWASRAGPSSPRVESARGYQKQLWRSLFALSPTTCVYPSLRSIFSHGTASFTFLYQLLRLSFASLASEIQMRISSAEKLIPPRFRYQPNWKRTPAMAQNLHAKFNETVAAGDAEALGNLCPLLLHERFKKLISRRRENERRTGAAKDRSHLRWDVIRYNSPPKLVQRCTFNIPPMAGLEMLNARPPILQQAIVRVDAVQRLARWRPAKNSSPSSSAPKLEMVNGSEKIQSMAENVVIQRHLDAKTFQPVGDWIFWGTVEVSTPESVKQIVDEQQMAKDKIEASARKQLTDMGLKPKDAK